MPQSISTVSTQRHDNLSRLRIKALYLHALLHFKLLFFPAHVTRYKKATCYLCSPFGEKKKTQHYQLGCSFGDVQRDLIWRMRMQTELATKAGASWLQDIQSK